MREAHHKKTTQGTVPLNEISRTGKSIETDSRLVGWLPRTGEGGQGEGEGMVARAYRGFLWGDENILKIPVGMVVYPLSL